MSCTPHQAVRDTSFSLGVLFDRIIGGFTEDIETVENGDIEIYDTAPPYVDPPPEKLPTSSTMVYSIIVRVDIHEY